MSGLAAYQAAFAAALRTPEEGAAPAWLDGEDRVRFRVYRNNVAVGLTDALGSAYPAVRKLVGDAFFRAMARAFLEVRPPRHRSLALFGEGFPAFVGDFPPARGLAYLGDVARLERAVLESLHAADAIPLAPEAVEALGASVAQARFVAHPATRVVASTHPVCSLWRAQQEGAGPVRLEARAEIALVTRPRDRVLVQALTPAQGGFAERVLDGARPDAAFAATTTEAGDVDPLDAWRPLLAGGAFAAVHPGEHR